MAMTMFLTGGTINEYFPDGETWAIAVSYTHLDSIVHCLFFLDDGTHSRTQSVCSLYRNSFYLEGLQVELDVYKRQDADIFGPSVPKMFQVEDARPYAEQIDGRDLIIPIEKYGIKLLSRCV